MPQSSFTFVGQIHDSAVDLSEASLLTPGTEATLQQEQVIETNATTRSGGVTVTDASGLHPSGPLITTSSSDSDVGSSTTVDERAHDQQRHPLLPRAPAT